MIRMLVILTVLAGLARSEVRAAEPGTATAPATRPSPFKPGDGFVLISWEQADRYVDRPAVVYGRIVQAKNTGSRCYLNFHQDFRNHLTVVISAKAFDQFPQPPEQLFRDQQVAVAGMVNNEVGRPEIAVTSADQLLILPPDQPVEEAIRARFPGVRRPADPGSARGANGATDIIRIGTYNILNLFDEYDDPYRDDEVMDTKSRGEMEKLAATIRRLDADVLALQEVENRFALERFVRTFLPDMGYEHVVLFEGNNQRGIDCALLSRLPVGPVTSHRHLTFSGPDGKTHRFRRDLLQARIEGPGDFTFDVFVVHLKSKYGGAEESEPIRQAEAMCIRRIVDERLYREPGARFVICGDFNDLWDSPSLKIIRGSGQTELTCPGSTLPEDQRVTYNREERYRSMIDFIVCSPQMRDRYVDGSYTIVPGTVDSSGSDHNPSVAGFRVR